MFDRIVFTKKKKIGSPTNGRSTPLEALLKDPHTGSSPGSVEEGCELFVRRYIPPINETAVKLEFMGKPLECRLGHSKLLVEASGMTSHQLVKPHLSRED